MQDQVLKRNSQRNLTKPTNRKLTKPPYLEAFFYITSKALFKVILSVFNALYFSVDLLNVFLLAGSSKP